MAGNSISKPSEFRTKLPRAVRGQVPEFAVSLTIGPYALYYVLCLENRVKGRLLTRKYRRLTWARVQAQ